MWFGEGVRGAFEMAGFPVLLGEIFSSCSFNIHVCKVSTFVKKIYNSIFCFCDNLCFYGLCLGDCTCHLTHFSCLRDNLKELLFVYVLCFFLINKFE